MSSVIMASFDALGDLQPRRAGIDHERADAARAGRLAGAREHAIEIGDAAVGDPGLLAIEHIAVAVGARLAGKRRHVRTRLGFGQRESGDRLAARHRRQVLLTQRIATHQRNGAAAQPLHGEREIGQPVVTRQGFAQDAHGARVDLGQAPAPATARPGRHRISQPAGLAEAAHQGAAGGVGVAMVDGRQRRAAPGLQFARQFAMEGVEEGPVLPGKIRHAQSPSNTGLRLATKAS
ncbi:Uncharacterised protein [Bordetella pertussis]|nr:Uncharacterised protein [Bordetella pertussis]